MAQVILLLSQVHGGKRRGLPVSEEAIARMDVCVRTSASPTVLRHAAAGSEWHGGTRGVEQLPGGDRASIQDALLVHHNLQLHHHYRGGYHQVAPFLSRPQAPLRSLWFAAPRPWHSRLTFLVLADLLALYPFPALYQMEQEMRFFLEGGYLTTDQAAMVRRAVRQLLVALRPDAVALVDAFNFSDHSLNSCLGRYGALLSTFLACSSVGTDDLGGMIIRWSCVRGTVRVRPARTSQPVTGGARL